MAKHGQTIQMFLMDGEADSRIKCTINGWTGVVYKIPRTQINLCKDRDHLKQSGVYFLIGSGADPSEKSSLYVGQAGARKNGEGLLNRIQEHKRNPEKEFWSEAIAITTTDNTFGPTEISWLENRFCSLANEANRAEVKNNIDPNSGNVSEETESFLEDFIEKTLIILGALGYKLFTPLTKEVNLDNSQTNFLQQDLLFYTETKSDNSSRTVKATGCLTPEGFVVLKGSRVALTPTTSCQNFIKKRRAKEQEKITKDGILLEDLLFNSPSTASAFVWFSNRNGNTDWHTSDGKQFGSFDF